MEKKVENSTKSQQKSGILGESLSKTAIKILKKIVEGERTVKGLIRSEKRKQSNVYKYLKELKDNGKITINYGTIHLSTISGGSHPGEGGEGVQESRTTVNNPERAQVNAGGGAEQGTKKHPPKPESPDTNKNMPFMRVHSLQFVLDILYPSSRYEQLREQTPYYYDDGNRIVRNQYNLEIYTEIDRSWIGEDVDTAMQSALEYINSLILRVQNQNFVTILKNRKESVHLRKIHIGRVGDPLAKDVIVNKKQCDRAFRIYYPDGKLRLIIDASHLTPELEAVGITAEEDMKECERHYQDWIEHPGTATSSEVMTLLKKEVEANVETASGLNALVRLVQMLLPNEKTLKPPAPSPDHTPNPKSDKGDRRTTDDYQGYA